MRGQATRTRTFYTLDRKILPGMHRSESATPFPDIANYEEMLQTAITLAEDFDYVRVDLKLGNWWRLDMGGGGGERPLPQNILTAK